MELARHALRMHRPHHAGRRRIDALHHALQGHVQPRMEGHHLANCAHPAVCPPSAVDRHLRKGYDKHIKMKACPKKL